MLVKVNSINEEKHKVKVTMLDIDDFGGIIALEKLELDLPYNDDSIISILKNSSYAAIFTKDNNNTIILANGITLDELDNEKKKTIDTVLNKK
jgi:ssDNA-specific exonuclease RecJ